MMSSLRRSTDPRKPVDSGPLPLSAIWGVALLLLASSIALASARPSSPSDTGAAIHSHHLPVASDRAEETRAAPAIDALPGYGRVQPGLTGAQDGSGREVQGGTIIKLSGTPMVGDIALFNASPDGEWTVYVADQETLGLLEIYSAKVDGSVSSLKLNGLFPPGAAGVSRFAISPDSTQVVYLADQVTAGQIELFSVSIGGGAAVRLNVDAPVSQFAISPDSSRVAYFAPDPISGNTEVSSVPISGPDTSSIRLSDVSTVGGADSASIADIGVKRRDATFSPDSSTVLYASDVNDPANDDADVFSVPAMGPASASVQISAQGISGVPLADLSPDGTTVVWFSDHRLRSAPISGGSSILTSLLNVFDFDLSPDSIWAAYLEESSPWEVYGVPIDASSTPVRLNTTPVTGGNVVTVNISQDSATVVFQGDLFVDGAYELFSAPIDGSEPQIQLHAVEPGDDVGFYNGIGTVVLRNRALYPLFTAGGSIDVYSVPVDGSQPPVRLNDPAQPGGFLSGSFLPFAGGKLVAISGPGAVVPDQVDVLAVPLDRSLPPILINGPLTPPQGVTGYLINSTETHGVYAADQDVVGRIELYSRALDSDLDGVENSTDNCPFISNSSQALLPLGHTVTAPNKTTFVWGGLEDVRFARGPIDGLDSGSYPTSLTGNLFEADAFVDATAPEAGTGSYYLFTLDCAGGSWGPGDRNQFLP